MHSRLLNKTGLYCLLSSLETSPGDFVTVYSEPDCFPDFMEKLSFVPEYNAYADEIRLAVKTEAVVNAAKRYETGAAVFWSNTGGKYMVLPPFPITANRVSAGNIDTSVLHEVLERRYVIGVVLVAWGSYALGVFDTGNLVGWKTGTGLIHKRHRKGGRSEKRFARRTEEQKKDFLRRIANRIEERFEGFDVDHIFFGGNRLIVKPLIKECKYLQSQAYKISPRILDVRHADRQVLVKSLTEITSSAVFTF